MILKLGMKDGVLQNLYKSLDDIDLFYGKVNLGRPCNGMGENRKMSFKGKKRARNEPMDRRVMLMKIVWAQGGCLPLPLGYNHVYDQNIFFSETARPIKAKLYVEHP